MREAERVTDTAGEVWRRGGGGVKVLTAREEKRRSKFQKQDEGREVKGQEVEKEEGEEGGGENRQSIFR